MPLRKSGSHEALQSNIREMVASGKKPKVAIAASLSNQRKYKKMAEGGMVEMEGSQEDMHEEAAMRSQAMGSIDSISDEGEAGEPINPIQDDPRGLSPNVEAMEGLAKALQAKGNISNDQHTMVSNESLSAAGHMQGNGDREPMSGDETPIVMHDGTEEPMAAEPRRAAAVDHTPIQGVPASSALSKSAMDAIARKKKMRKYEQKPQ